MRPAQALNRRLPKPLRQWSDSESFDVAPGRHETIFWVANRQVELGDGPGERSLLVVA
jgi:hypothetical protein